ncbi:aspartate ammonia-lyase [Microbacterium trichothecenolyticum]|uniref:aspartate ammonia-lyase n=1 Tax=Microbacterium trichothecenolyticum TaxID=69370 RepID=UPI001C6E1726|nr:aspartate ammonia-lyase [Microbacterium trichothecenolyticum]MBW9119616.1 aspartate ammonia-lyase [Microbacterium trichothecenolyticum]
MSTVETRLERDSLGELEVPAEAYWGIHTARARENFTISTTPISQHPDLVRALVTVKDAAAAANGELGLLPAGVTEAIAFACRRVRDGELHDQFCVDVLQGGAGTSTNMNANEVIANAALENLGLPRGRYDVVHPINDVNRSQSTNDVYPTAVKIAVANGLLRLVPALEELARAFEERGAAFRSIVKIGRTQLQDAVPMTLGDEFAAFGVAIREDVVRIGDTVPLLLECSLGGTAVGTGVTAPPGYRDVALERLRERSGLPMTPAAHLFEASWDVSALLQSSAVLRRTAIKLSKISSDLRLLASGPQAGLGEIRLPARQAGSSIMPGKVNPVIPEVMNQIAFAVMGADVTIGVAAESGQLQLNAFEPIMAHSLLQSISWVTNGVSALRRFCVEGIEADETVLARYVASSVGAVTALVPTIGYEAAAHAAQDALRTGIPIADAVSQHTALSREEVAELLAH